MRVLVVTGQVPDVEGGAAGRSSVALLRGLRAHGLDVHAIAPRIRGSQEAPPEDVPVELVDVALPTLGGVRGLAERARKPVHELARTQLSQAVADAARTADVVHLDQIETACLGPLAGVPTVLHLHYRALLDAALGAPWQRAFRHRVELAAAERRALRRFDWLLAGSSDVARDIARARPGADVTIAPFPLDPADYPVARSGAGPVVGILGTASWAPTAGAICRLVFDLWPAIRRRVPLARLLVAGRGTDELLRHRTLPAGVEALGEVPSAHGFFRDLSLLAYPATRGSGPKVKVLEALASGVPVVATPPGGEGLESTEGVIVLERDPDFVDACVRLLTDPDEQRRRAAAGRSYLLSRHGPLPATAPVVDLYRRMRASAAG